MFLDVVRAKMNIIKEIETKRKKENMMSTTRKAKKHKKRR
jgi:hypothetical protein